MNDFKIFELRWTEIGEKEWVAARTNIEALKCYFNTTSTDINDLDDIDEIAEVPKEKWITMTIRNSDYNSNDPEDWQIKTFEEYMKDQKTPDIIAGTMYE
jgi:hypothetical protein